MHWHAGLIAPLMLVAGVTALYLWTARSPSQRTGRRTAGHPRRPAPAPCPVDPAQQAWIEQSIRWCTEQFGEKAARQTVALPTSDFIPSPYTASAPEVGRLFERVCALMGVDGERIDFRLRETLDDRPPNAADARHLVGYYRRRYFRLRWSGQRLFWLGRARIEVERGQAADPVRLVAIMAHELGHQRLLGEGRVTSAQADQERLTDLLTVYLGLGVFSANASQGSTGSPHDPPRAPTGLVLNAAAHGSPGRLGYLTAQEYGYILACYCRLRGEHTAPTWAWHLHPRIRAYLEQGLAFIAEMARPDRTGPGDAATQRPVSAADAAGPAGRI